MEESQVLELAERMKKMLEPFLQEIVKSEVDKLYESRATDIEKLKIDCDRLKWSGSKQTKIVDKMTRVNNLLFFGFLEESGERKCHLLQKVLNICCAVLQIYITRNDVSYIRRIGKGGSRPILVSFVSNLKKCEVLDQAYKFKGTKIWVSEDLDLNFREQRRFLERVLRRVRKTGKPCWRRGRCLEIDGRRVTYTELAE
ncbi:unnamed protein product [Bemisia tabaci]|uniref:Endonuclease-reverse transcriptase n=1 Tax=Bemisia tabaci TaxID=7038 RepID=A0A9P0AHN0_BEMTA|nr:unnamed protein product [Bemisia tabaci]